MFPNQHHKALVRATRIEPRRRRPQDRLQRPILIAAQKGGDLIDYCVEAHFQPLFFFASHDRGVRVLVVGIC
jgi:hypothetical protein